MKNTNLAQVFEQIINTQNQEKPDYRWKNVKEVAEELGITQEDWNGLKQEFEQKIQTGHNFLEHHNYQDAEEAFKEANQLFPNHVKVNLGLCFTNELAYYQTNQSKFAKDAIQFGEKVITQSSKEQRAFEVVSKLKKELAKRNQKFRKVWIKRSILLIFLLTAGFFVWRYWSDIKPKLQEMADFFRSKKAGTSFVLEDVQFGLGSIVLDTKAREELDRLVDFLKENPDVKGEVSGHTDNSGNQANNMLVSSQRAEVVHQYLRQKGIPENQIVYKGYGDSKPKFPNDSESNKAKNRRIEFKITESQE